MPSCPAIDCNNGFDDGPLPPGITFHRFPRNEERRKFWVQQLHRDDGFTATENSRICSAHFAPTDYKYDHTAQRRLLKDGAYPHIFTGRAKHLTKESPASRPPKATASSRLRAQNERLQEQMEVFEQEDSVNTVEQIVEKLKNERALDGFVILEEANCLVLCRICTKQPQFPKLLGSITLAKDLTVSIARQEKPVKPNQYDHIVTGKLKRFSELINLMAWLKGLTGKNQECVGTIDYSWIESATQCLEQFISAHEQNEETEASLRKAKFLLTQLQLLPKPANSRRYSLESLLSAYSINAYSPKAYEELRRQDNLTLPDTTTLGSLFRDLKVHTAADTTDDSYLELRLKTAYGDKRKLVNVIHDEIFLRAELQYVGAQGKMHGMTENCELAKTALCFMVSSLLSKDRDIVAIYPANKLKADDLRKATLQVLKRLSRLGFTVVSIIADNHPTNRNLFTRLGGDKLKVKVSNPVTKEPLFVLFDPVHNFKNFYNNWVNRELFQFPPGNTFLLTSADFNHIRALYQHENGKPVKIAHQLRKTALNPSSLQKTNVQLANSVFNEKTAAAMSSDAYGRDERGDWTESGKFVSAVTTLWKIMNTRTRYHGEHKRDVYREPITSMDGPQIQFLREFIVFLDQWKAMGQRSTSLTNETFLAVRHTCEALIALSKYCLEKLHMDFVMLGKFTQDFLEGRFGWLRQLSGANYYLTMAQLLQNEKKIRAQTLISHSDVTREDLKCLAVPPATAELCKLAGEMATTISQLLEARGSDAEEQDASTVQFVAGALVKVETEHRHCKDCEAMLVQQRKAEMPMVVEFEDEAIQNENINSLIEAMTRGGLLVPTTVAFAICWKARNVFNCVKNDTELYSQLWKNDNSKALFAEIVMNLLEDDRDLMDIVVSGKLSCESDHECGKSIVIRFFNCCAKNLAKDTAPFQAAPRRKALKLTAQ